MSGTTPGTGFTASPSPSLGASAEARARRFISELEGHHFIAGRPVPPRHGRTFLSINPATEEPLGAFASGTAEDVDLAVVAAERAFRNGWGSMEPDVRGQLLQRIAERIRANAEVLAWLDTLDAGRPIRDTLGRDVERAARIFEFYAGLPDKIRGSTIPVGERFLNYTRREPYGVVAAITPWNYPLTNAATKLAPALACGNTVVLKPAEQTPLSALFLARLCSEAGLPDGVVNVVTGFGPEAGAPLVAHPRVSKIAFTGSTAVGQEVVRRSAEGLKSVTLELGGKSPNLVFKDAPIDEAVDAALFTVFMHQGQTCTAGTRLLVERPIVDEVIQRLVQRARSLRIGDPRLADVQIGPLISAEQRDRVLRYVTLGREAGARLCLSPEAGGGPTVPSRGYFLGPHIFTGVTPEMRIAREEIFGPVLSVLTFNDEAEAVALANDVLYGLAATVWTSDLRRAHRLATLIEAGIIWVNTVHSLAPGSPYGGYKQSGLGVEMGLEAIDQFMRVKSVWVNLEPWKSPWSEG